MQLVAQMRDMFDLFARFKRKNKQPGRESDRKQTGARRRHPNEMAAPIDRLQAKFKIGQVVKHRMFPFRGVIFDVDPQFANSDEWYEAIPEEVRPAKNQPYYHLFAENETTHYLAYVSEGNLLADDSAKPVQHPDIPTMFELSETGAYVMRHDIAN